MRREVVFKFDFSFSSVFEFWAEQFLIVKKNDRLLLNRANNLWFCYIFIFKSIASKARCIFLVIHIIFVKRFSNIIKISARMIIAEILYIYSILFYSESSGVARFLDLGCSDDKNYFFKIFSLFFTFWYLLNGKW